MIYLNKKVPSYKTAIIQMSHFLYSSCRIIFFKETFKFCCCKKNIVLGGEGMKIKHYDNQRKKNALCALNMHNAIIIGFLGHAEFALVYSLLFLPTFLLSYDVGPYVQSNSASL